jgi:hypothetical protein
MPAIRTRSTSPEGGTRVRLGATAPPLGIAPLDAYGEDVVDVGRRRQPGLPVHRRL